MEAAVHAAGLLGKHCWQVEVIQMGLESNARLDRFGAAIPRKQSGGGAAVGTAEVPSLSVLLARLHC